MTSRAYSRLRTANRNELQKGKQMTIFIDIHALQTLPPSNINRDLQGAPKTATFGGVPRQRVSSQAWKHAIREQFKHQSGLDLAGVRTKRVVSAIAKEVIAQDPSWSQEDAEKAAVKILNAAKIKTSTPKAKDGQDLRAEETGYLVFLSKRQIQNIAGALVANPDVKVSKKDLTALFDTEHSYDIAMFGRMIAEAPEYNVDASVQVAHAIGVSATEPEFDFFTAVDDVVREAKETGAGMMDTIQMMSSTLYRYATVNVDALFKNLGSTEATENAIVAFLDAFMTSLPTGKLNTFANQTLPYAVVVSVRNDRPISWVNAFEDALTNEDHGFREVAAKRLASEAKGIDAMYDRKPIFTWVISQLGDNDPLGEIGEKTTRNQMLAGVRAQVAAALPKDN